MLVAALILIATIVYYFGINRILGELIMTFFLAYYDLFFRKKSCWHIPVKVKKM